MRVLFDIVHPAHVHFFRHLIRALQDEGHHTLVVARRKDVTTELLGAYRIPYVSVGSSGDKGLFRQASELAFRDIALLRQARRFRPDLILTRNPAGVQVARLLPNCTGVFDTDDGRAAGIHFRVAAPFAHVITTPVCIGETYGRRHRRYPGFKAQAYLHPDLYTPDPSVRDLLGVSAEERYFIVRFVANIAAHDRNVAGLADVDKQRIVDYLQTQGRVFISSEGPLPPHLAELRLPIPATRIHDALAFASACVGDSQTVAAEAALLGVPTFRASTWTGRLGYLQELERYGLMRSFLPRQGDELLAATRDAVEDPGSMALWADRQAKMLEETVNVSSWYRALVHELA